MFFLIKHCIGMYATIKVLEVLKTDHILVKLANPKRIYAIKVEFFAKILMQSGRNKSDLQAKNSQNI